MEIAPLLLVMFFWGLTLGYPMQLLEHVRCRFLGYEIPVYYFFTVLPVLSASAWGLWRKRSWTQWELLWCLLPLICLPGILYSDDRLWSIRQWLSWLVRGVIPGGMIFLTARWEDARTLIIYWIYPVIIAASLLGLTELYSDHNFLWDKLFAPIPATSQPENPFYRPIPRRTDTVISRRPMGTQGNRIPYASSLVAFLPLGFWLFRYRKRFYLAYLLAGVLLFCILILAQVRAVWLATLVGLILMPRLGLLSREQTANVVVGLSLCLAIFMIWPQTRSLLWTRFHSFHLSENSIRERLEAFQTVKLLKHHWFAGIGFGQFPTAGKQFYPSELVWNYTPDNQYLRWAIENGLPSFGLLLAFLVGLIRASWENIQKMAEAQQTDFYKSLLVGWLSVAVTFLFFDGFYWGACNMTFWCFLGLFSTCLSSQNQAPHIPPQHG